MTFGRLNDEALLAALLTGETSEDEPEVKERLNRNPELASRWREFRGVVDSLERSADVQQEILAEARRGEDAPGLERVAAMRAEKSPSQPRSLGSPARPRWLSPALWVAAAVVVAALAYWLGTRSGDQPGRLPERSIGTEITGLSPSGSGASFERFTWTYPAQPGSEYRVLIRDAESRDELPGSYRLSVPEWKPDPETISTWPQQIDWRVEVWTEGIRVARSDWVSASR
ncbi:MAG: hypothetical protein RL885_17425 [Planctomycetota bacterium]